MPQTGFIRNRALSGGSKGDQRRGGLCAPGNGYTPGSRGCDFTNKGCTLVLSPDCISLKFMASRDSVEINAKKIQAAHWFSTRIGTHLRRYFWRKTFLRMSGQNSWKMLLRTADSICVPQFMAVCFRPRSSGG